MKHRGLATILLIAAGAIGCLCFAFTNSKTIAPTEKEPGNNPGDVGSVSFVYRGKLVTYTTVRANDGNIWLQQNLGSRAVARNARDEAGFGDLFQWGRWDDGHQVVDVPNTRAGWPKNNNPSGIDPNSHNNPFFYDDASPWWRDGVITDKWDASTPQQATAEDGCDPCKILGNGWHIPTWDEFEAATKAENITDENGAYASNLKLTLAGVRKYDYNITFDRGKTGDYWTANGFKDGIAAALDLASGQFGGYHRGMGMSLRCMKSKK